MFSDKKNFYPTPSSLASKMICLIKGHPKNILESQAERSIRDIDMVISYFDGGTAVKQ